MEQKQIGAVARELGVNPKTIRYYEQIGLLPPPRRTETGYRIYLQADIERIGFILRARDLDFSLDDIGEILALRERGDIPCRYVTELVDEQIEAIGAKIAALKQLRDELKEIQRQANEIPLEIIASKDCVCHLIENSRTAWH